MAQTPDQTRSLQQKQNKDGLVQELIRTVALIQQRFQTEDEEEKRWLLQNSQNPVILAYLQEMTAMMLHVLDAIGRMEPVNGITISRQFGIPKGSVSKITRRLAADQLIRTEVLPDNKKEVHFSTTPLGKEIFYLHKALRQQIDIGVNRFLQRYSANELRFLIQCLQDTMGASWIDPEHYPPNLSAQEEVDKQEEDIQPGTREQVKPRESAEFADLMHLMRTLDAGQLKKAKAILTDVFITEFED